MKNIIAVSLCIILLRCEWHDSVLSFLKNDSSCSTSCCAEKCDGTTPQKQKNDCSNNSPDEMKNCCVYCCCYLPPVLNQVAIFRDAIEMYFSENSLSNISFSSDCFHPPELV